jgi:hypothetical protein
MELLKVYTFCNIKSCSRLKEVKHYGLISINSILFGIRKKLITCGRSLLLHKFTRRSIEMNVIIIVGCHCYQLHTKFYLISFPQNMDDIIGIISIGFDLIDQLLIGFCEFVTYCRRNGSTMRR